MSFHSWLQNLRSALTGQSHGRQRQPRSPRIATYRPNVETLEDRALPSFSPVTSFPVGPSPATVATGDFNNDGHLDLVAANLVIGASVSVVLGNGDGTFQPPQTAPGLAAASVAVGDFNADGKLDVATVDFGAVSVLLGNGNGTFQAPTAIPNTDGDSVAVGDFNGDGKLDLGVMSNGYTPGHYGPGSWGYYGGYYPGTWYPGYFTSSASVLLGHGDGSFSGPTTTDLGEGYQGSALAADLNGDGFDDLVTINSGNDDASVMLGTSNGDLQSPSLFSTGAYCYSLAAADLNADGHMDLVLGCDADLVTASDEGVWVLLGNGAGGFAGPQHFDVGNRVDALVLGDFSGDGKLDAATGTYDSASVSILRGQGNGAFADPETFATDSTASALAAGDFSGDGWLDLATVNPDGDSVSVMINDQSWPTLPTLSVSDATVMEGNTGTVNAAFTASLSSATNVDVVVHYATADGWATAGSDYVATSGAVVIPAGQTSATFTVAVMGDRLAEGDETFTVNVTSATNTTIADGRAIGTILDDEPRISVGDATVTEGDTGTRPMTFSVSLSAPYDVPVTVDYSTGDGWAKAGSDYVVTAGTLTFAPGETSKTITVQVIGDRIDEMDESFSVYLSNLTNASVTNGGWGTGLIVDDDTYLLSISDASVVEGNSGTRNMSFAVTLSAASPVPVTVWYSAAGVSATYGVDYLSTYGTLTFAPGQTSKSITVQVIGDRFAEGNETFIVYLESVTNATLADGQGIGTIVDDEPRISISDVSKNEGKNGQTTFTFTVTLSAAYDQPVTLSYSTANGTATTGDGDYLAKSGTITFKPGETTKTITIDVKGDSKKEANEMFYVDLFGLSSNALFTKNRGIGTILNDD